ncbi:MAG: DUF2793 domain-containing protein [Pseudomonadota bacterium]
MESTPNLVLPYIMPSQAQKHVTHNEAIRKLDALVQLAVVDRTLTAPPASPTDGGRYIIASPATGDWLGRENQLAAWQDGAWAYFTPQSGWLARAINENTTLVFDGSAWVSASTQSSFSTLGINGSADLTNRLTVSSPATLFNHEGDGHQFKVNKNTPTDTASLLFQTGFSGRAEMGLAGSDDFSFKVSPDGSQFYDAIAIDRSNGTVSFPSGVSGGPSGGNGKINQIVGARFTDQHETNSTSWVDIPGATVDLTPSDIASKIELTVWLSTGGSSSWGSYVRLLRNGTEILSGIGNSGMSGNGNGGCFLHCYSSIAYAPMLWSSGGVDEPATSAPLTYKLQWRVGSTSHPAYINQGSLKRNDSGYGAVTASQIVAKEILA